MGTCFTKCWNRRRRRLLLSSTTSSTSIKKSISIPEEERTSLLIPVESQSIEQETSIEQSISIPERTSLIPVESSQSIEQETSIESTSIKQSISIPERTSLIPPVESQSIEPERRPIECTEPHSIPERTLIPVESQSIEPERPIECTETEPHHYEIVASLKVHQESLKVHQETLKSENNGDVGIEVLAPVYDDTKPPCYPNKQDASVQFDYLVFSSDHLYGVHIAEKKLFYIQGSDAQSLYWEEYGLRIHLSQNTVSLSEICEVAVTVLVGGYFKFPEESMLVSAIYDISIVKPLLKPLMLEIQHCVNLHTQAEAKCLRFVRANLHPPTLPYEFTQMLDGGEFYPGNRYGSITSDHFSPVAIVAEWNQQTQDNSDNEGSSDEEESSSSQENGSVGNEKKKEDDHEEKNSIHSQEESSVGNEEKKEDDPEEKDSSHSQKESHSCVTNKEKVEDDPMKKLDSNMVLPPIPSSTPLDTISQCSDDPKPKNKILLFMYSAMTCYEEKDRDWWIVRFFVVKDLNALLSYLKQEYQQVDKDDPVDFNFVDQYGYIELIFSEEQTPPGWKIIPIVKPCKLWQAKIDEFGSSNRPIPSSCQLKVYAVDNPDTVEHFEYPIILDGIDPQMTITIHRKVIKRPSIPGAVVMSQVQGASIKDQFSPVPVNTDIDISKMRKLVRKVLNENHALLIDLPELSLPILATKMLSASLISTGVHKAPTFDGIIYEFIAKMNFKRNHTQLQEDLKKLLSCFNEVGGSFADAARVLQDEWTDIISKELNIELNL